MRKLFSIMLMATALLISGNVKADTDCTWSVDGVSQGAASLQMVLTDISDINKTECLYSDKSIEITLTNSVVFSGGSATTYLDFGFTNGQNVVLDLGNGNNISGAGFRFKIGKAKMEIKGKGSLTHTAFPATSSCMFYLCGRDVDDESYAITPASYLIIGKDVVIDSKGYALGFMYSGYYGGTTPNKNDKARCYGSRADIYGKLTSSGDAVLSVLGTLHATDGNVPVINLFEGSEIICTNSYLKPYSAQDATAQNEIKKVYPDDYANYKEAATAVYGAGYGKWNIKGLVSGGNGIYIKGGAFNIDGAQIYATAPEYWKPVYYGNGGIACGSAIILDNNENYNQGKNGYMQLEITGETYVEAIGGSAIEEVTTEGTTVLTGADIKIESGTFVGSEENGCIKISDELVAASVKEYESIKGGTYSDETVRDYINEYPDGDAIVNVVTKSSDETVYVIGSKPSEKAWVTDINAAVAGDYVKIDEEGADITLNGNKEMEYLTISKARKVIVPTGKKLSVGEIVLCADAIIEVEAGGKLIVNGTNGLVAFEPENVVLKADANGYGKFVLNPDVKANKTPYATVEFYAANARQYASALPVEENDWAIMTCPFVSISSITNNLTDENSVDPQGEGAWSAWQMWDGNNWVNVSKATLMENAKPFQPFAVTNSADKTKGFVTYTFQGQLQGNTSGKLPLDSKYNYIGNAYVADMNTSELLNALVAAGDIEPIIWVWNAEDQAYEHMTIDNNLVNMDGLQFFMIKNKSAKELNFDYKKLVWDLNK